MESRTTSGPRTSEESAPQGVTIPGFGLLPVETDFHPEKTVVAVERELSPVSVLGGETGRVSGYEIHAGETTLLEAVDSPFPAGDGASMENVLGTYLHGLFENEVAREGFVDAVFEHAGRSRPTGDLDVESPFERAASLLESHTDSGVVTDFLPVRTRKH